MSRAHRVIRTGRTGRTDRVRRPSSVATGVRLAMLALVIGACGVLGAGGATCARAGELTFDKIFADGGAGRAPTGIAWAPDGKRVAYLWKDDTEEGLWTLDVETGRSRLLLGEEEASKSGLEKLAKAQWSPSGSSMLMASGGDLFLIDARDGSSRVRRLTETDEKEEDPKFSPSGNRVAFVRDYDLFLLDLDSGNERALTAGGSENEILNGTTDWVYWEEIWGRDATGFWWSPAGDRIAFYQFDDRGVKSYPLVDFTTQYPEVKWQKYPKAGEDNPVVRVGVLDLASDKTLWLDTGEVNGSADVYLARVDWRLSGDAVAVQRLNRDQNRLDLLLCDPGTGACSTLLTERSETWVSLTEDLRFLPDNRFLWTSEGSGWNRLELHSPTGEMERDLTPEGWNVTQVDSLGADDASVIYTAFRIGGLGAIQRVVFSQALSGGTPKSLGTESGWSQARVAPASGNLVLSTSGADEPAESVVLDSRGDEIGRLPVALPPYDSSTLPAWEFFTLPGPDGLALPAAILKPPGLDTTRKYPAVMYHYGGPASQVVANRWRGTRNLWHKMMAQRGYVVLMVDNAGSSFFGAHGAGLLHRRFGEINLAAQRAGFEYLRRLGYVDTERVGLWGWSGGGSNTLYSLLNSPGTWKAGVSGAPVTDWRFYDSIWTERYLDHPKDNPDGYRDSSSITYAGELKDELLIVHGTADDNVHPQNTIAFARKLIDAGIHFEDAIYPRQKHGFRGGDSQHFYERMTEFFDRHLGDASGSLAKRPGS